MRKILLLIICILLITGCKVEYKININNDFTINEEVKMTGSDEFFDIYYKSSRLNVINTVFTDSEKTLLKDNKYNFEIIETETPYVLASKKHLSVEDFAKDTLFYKQYYDSLKVSNDNGIVTIDTEEFLGNSVNDPNRYDIKNAKISISIGYKVLESNSSNYDEKTNTYTWYVNHDTTESKIHLVYDTNNVFKHEDENNDLMIIIYILILVVVIIIYAVYKSKNKNK